MLQPQFQALQLAFHLQRHKRAVLRPVNAGPPFAKDVVVRPISWWSLIVVSCAPVADPPSIDAGASTSPYFVGGLGGAGGGGVAVLGGGASEPIAGGPALDAGRPPTRPAFTNEPFEIPDAGTPAQAMTCPWLDGQNCWKAQMERFTGCGVPVESVGQFSPDGKICTFDGGRVLEFSDGRAFVPDAGTSQWFVAMQLRDAQGEVCFETAFALGKSRFKTKNAELFSYSLSLLEYEVMCPDRSRFNNVGSNGACSNFGARYFGGQVPGHDIFCEGLECRIQFTGMPEGRRTAARCRR